MNTPFESKWNITGRGLVYVVDTRKIDYEINIGDIIYFEDIKYTIRGLEKTINGFGETKPNIGVLVRKVDY